MAEEVKTNSSILMDELLQKNMPRIILSKIHKSIESRARQILGY